MGYDNGFILQNENCSEVRIAFIDTLPLSPLLFPKKPYHRLLKDDKLQVDELNNPVNDAKKARDLFFDEVAAWGQLSVGKQKIFQSLLSDTREFKGFLEYLSTTENTITSQHTEQEFGMLIREEFRGLICGSANTRGCRETLSH